MQLKSILTDKNIAPHASSDIHGITSEFYNLNKYHRPMTLVLATERSEEAIREALFANRTIAYFGHNLAGNETFLKAFFNAATQVSFYDENQKGKNYIFKNNSDVPFFLVSGKVNFIIPANGETLINIPKNFINTFQVSNCFVNGSTNLQISLPL